MSLDSIAPDIVLKTTPPRIPKALLFRGRLSSEGAEFRDKTVIEIHAPAGFGKTSLLGQWRREYLNRGHLVAWLTLDELDDGVRFAQGLAYAMRVASGRPVFERSVLQSMRQSPGAVDALTAWLAELTHLGAETLLILDEVQSAPATLQQALLYLFLNAPPNLTIILAGRKRLSLPLSDLQARGLYMQIGAERLRFTQQETGRVLAARFGARLGPDDCARLHEKTAGWPLGLQVAISAIAIAPGTMIETLTAASEGFESYFRENMFTRLDTPIADFLVRISVLDALHADLCRAVTDNDNASELLEHLRDSLPIFIEGANGEWMRIHPMAREFLLGQLKNMPATTRALLHERAARWLAERQMLEEAASQALAAGLNDFAYRLIGDCLRSVMVSGHQLRVLYWLDRIPRAELERHPPLLLAAAWALAESERHAEAAQLVEQIAADPTATPDQRLESAMISAAAAYFADHIDDTARLLAPWRDVELPESLELRTIIAADGVAMIVLYEGKPEQARHLVRAALAPWPSNFDGVRAWGEWVIGFSYLWEGQVQLGHDALQESLLRAEEALGRRAALSVMFASSLSLALWEIGKPEEAAEMLVDRLDLLERVSPPEAIAMGYQTAARAAAHSGDERRAFDLLENLFALGAARRIPRFCITSLAEQIRSHALQGHTNACSSACSRLEAIVKPFGKTRHGLLQSLHDLRAAIALAYGALAIRDWDRMQVLLAPAQEVAERLRRGREGIEIKLLAALASKHKGEDADAQVIEAMSLARIFGLRSTLADVRPDLFSWAQGGPPRGYGSALSLPQDSTVPRRGESRAASRVTTPTTSGLLTAKEEEVLHLLEKNFSNKHIASTLGVSDETIKWHIKNLFGKLNAGSRKHVVDRARMLGILAQAA